MRIAKKVFMVVLCQSLNFVKVAPKTNRLPITIGKPPSLRELKERNNEKDARMACEPLYPSLMNKSKKNGNVSPPMNVHELGLVEGIIKSASGTKLIRMAEILFLFLYLELYKIIPTRTEKIKLFVRRISSVVSMTFFEAYIE
jgi:hypothetical protein